MPIILTVGFVIQCTAKCIHALMKQFIHKVFGERQGQYVQMIKLEENVFDT